MSVGVHTRPLGVAGGALHDQPLRPVGILSSMQQAGAARAEVGGSPTCLPYLQHPAHPAPCADHQQGGRHQQRDVVGGRPPGHSGRGRAGGLDGGQQLAVLLGLIL